MRSGRVEERLSHALAPGAQGACYSAEWASGLSGRKALTGGWRELRTGGAAVSGSRELSFDPNRIPSGARLRLAQQGGRLPCLLCKEV